MATSLTNEKMHPALRARIERSVSGRPVQSRRLRLRSALRLVLATVVVGAVAFGLLQWRERRAELERRRSELAAEIASSVEALHSSNRLVAVAREAIEGDAGAAWRGERRDSRLFEPGAFARLLKRPAIYLRAPLDAARGRLDEAAADSVADAFLVCLLNPPASLREGDLAQRVEIAYRGGPARPEPRSQPHRLHDLLSGHRFAAGPWQDELQGAANLAALDDLRQRLEKAQLARAREAADADLLVYALDEPKRPGTPTELDGASDHFIRVGIIEIESGELVLRTRRRVEPSWISDHRRAYFARGLLDCRLAGEIHAALDR